MRLDDEAQRIIDFLTREKERLLPQLARVERERSAAKAFAQLSKELISSLESELRPELGRIGSYARLQAEVASSELDNLFKSVETAMSFLSNVAVGQDEIPRELYRLVDWFLDKCEGIRRRPEYVIMVSSELATLDFSRWLLALFPKMRGLLERFSDRSFSFFHVPGWMVPTSSCLDWPLIFHECAHAVENIENVVGPLFPHLPADWATLNKLARQARDKQPQEALLCHEFVCDFIATHAAGPVFVWRFARDNFSVSRAIHQSPSHPTPDIRIHQLARVLKERGFTSEAAKAESLLQEQTQGVKTVPAPPVAITCAGRAESAYKGRVKGFESNQYLANLRNVSGGDPERLREDILNKRPVLLDPASLFTIVAFDRRCEDVHISELLADCLRLHAIDERYHKERFKE